MGLSMSDFGCPLGLVPQGETEIRLRNSGESPFWQQQSVPAKAGTPLVHEERVVTQLPVRVMPPLGSASPSEVIVAGVPDNGTTTDSGLVVVGLYVNSISQLAPAGSVVPQLVSMVNGALTVPSVIVSADVVEFESSVA